MAIFVHDTRDKAGKHNNVDTYLIRCGHQIVRSKMYVGDITLLNNQSVCIDLKKDMKEIVMNLCQEHSRFRDEVIRAGESGIRLVILIEESSIKSLQDVQNWINPRLKTSPMAMSGERAFKVMSAMQNKYPNLEFRFCDKRSTGKIICEILGI